MLTRRHFLGLSLGGLLAAAGIRPDRTTASSGHEALERLVTSGRIQLYFHLQGPDWRKHYTDMIDGQPYKRLVPYLGYGDSKSGWFFRGWEDPANVSTNAKPSVKVGVLWVWEGVGSTGIAVLDDAVWMSLWQRADGVAVEMAKLDAGPIEHLLYLDGVAHRITWQHSPEYRLWPAASETLPGGVTANTT